MDIRTALIAGTAFAGVLVAGALAAPLVEGPDDADETQGVPIATASGQPADGTFVQAVNSDWDDDDDDHDDGDRDRDDDDHDDDHDGDDD